MEGVVTNIPRQQWGTQFAAALITGAAVWGLLTWLDYPAPLFLGALVVVIMLAAGMLEGAWASRKARGSGVG